MSRAQTGTELKGGGSSSKLARLSVFSCDLSALLAEQLAFFPSLPTMAGEPQCFFEGTQAGEPAMATLTGLCRSSYHS